jgi:hypothetical protein
MERMISKLTSAFVVLLLLVTAAAMAKSQTRRKSTPVDKKTGTEAIVALKNDDPSDINDIRCRGYSGTGGSQYVFFTINSRPSPTGETIITYEMAFTPSVKAAGSRGEGLRPGECSFVDRPISERGPYRIRFETPANAQLKQQLHGTPVDTSPTAAERFPDVQTIPAYLRDPNHYWSFFGAKPSGKFFLATGHKFWKPGLEVVRPVDSKRTNKDNPYVLAPKKPE